MGPTPPNRTAASALCCALALAWGCAPEVDAGLEPDDVQRPNIETGADRCGPVEIVGLDHAARIIDGAGGALLIIGNHFLPRQIPVGRIVRLYPDAEYDAQRFELESPIHAVAASGNQMILTGDQGAGYPWTLRPLAGEAAFNDGFAFWSITTFDSPVTTTTSVTGRGRHVFIGGSRRYGPDHRMRVIPSVQGFRIGTGERVYLTPIYPPEGEGGLNDEDARVNSLLYVPDADRLLVAGNNAIRIAIEDPVDENGDPIPGPVYVDEPPRLGMLATLTAAGDLVKSRHWPQRELEPRKLVLDGQGRPWVLAVEGHQGKRYAEGRSFMARIDPVGLDIVERIEAPIPAGITLSGLLDAIPLDDGGWLLGGSVCGAERTWCQAWIARIDARGALLWERRTTRDVASAVTDLHLVGKDRVIATVSSSVYCCQWHRLHQDAWLWELELDGRCPVDGALKRDGRILR